MSRIKKFIKEPTLNSGFPTIGKIKVGMKSAKGYPTSLDYFVADGKYASLFSQSYGEKPNSITVVFMSDNISEVCNQRYELRDNSGALFADGDGENFRVYNRGSDSYVSCSISDYPNLLEQVVAKSGSRKGWEVALTLRFMLPEIKGVFGLWQFTTKGEASSVPAIVGAFDNVQQHAGTVVGVPFDLQVEKIKSQKPNSRSTFPIVRLIPNISEPNIRKLASMKASGQDLQKFGLLTDETINQIEQPKQLEE